MSVDPGRTADSVAARLSRNAVALDPLVYRRSVIFSCLGSSVAARRRVVIYARGSSSGPFSRGRVSRGSFLRTMTNRRSTTPVAYGGCARAISAFGGSTRGLRLCSVLARRVSACTSSGA